MPMMYHGTSSHNLDSILKHGLMPKKPSTEGHYKEFDEQPKGVYMSTLPEVAKIWGRSAVTLEKLYLDNQSTVKTNRLAVCVLTVEINEDELNPDPEVVNSFYIERVIRPEEICHVEEGFE